MPLTIMPVSLLFAAALALLNLWLTWRVGQVRRSERISVGDGGNERVTRRMRAHANFAENAPIAAVLAILVEATTGTGWWLAGLAIVFLAARVIHAVGMDGWMTGRMAGVVGTVLVQLVLAGWAMSIPLLDHAAAPINATDLMEPRG